MSHNDVLRHPNVANVEKAKSVKSGEILMKSLCNSHEIREILIFIIKKEIGTYTHNLSFIESKDFKDFVGIA